MNMHQPHGDSAARAREACRQLLKRIRRRLQSQQDPAGCLVRAAIRIDSLDPLNWLHAQAGRTRYYWSSRDGAFEMAGIGEADVLVPVEGMDLPGLFQEMRRRLSLEWPHLRYYGGFRFRETDEIHHRWRNFRAYRFIVPQVEVVRQGEKTWLACNVRVGTPESNSSAFRSLEQLLTATPFPDVPLPCPLPPVVGRVDLPDRAAWNDLVARALQAFTEGKLEKVVLARETEFHFAGNGAVDPVGMLRRLLRHTNRSYEFCFQPSASRAFLGASPERLFHRRNVYLESEALAGTRPRGGTDAIDKALGQDLLTNEKELREHRFVVRALREHFGRFCVSTNYDERPSLRRLRKVQHLHTYVEGILKNHDSDAALIEALHPTPAVGGHPRQNALDWIAANEPFDRGIYAAPVGWVGFDDAEFCVGIRSGLIENNTLALYSGAGIVPGSSAAAEWDEIENKMGNFLEALYDHPE
jgi:menaquinone-specific isochorismate synthase